MLSNIKLEKHMTYSVNLSSAVGRIHPFNHISSNKAFAVINFVLLIAAGRTFEVDNIKLISPVEIFIRHRWTKYFHGTQYKKILKVETLCLHDLILLLLAPCFPRCWGMSTVSRISCLSFFCSVFRLLFTWCSTKFLLAMLWSNSCIKFWLFSYVPPSDTCHEVADFSCRQSSFLNQKHQQQLIVDCPLPSALVIWDNSFHTAEGLYLITDLANKHLSIENGIFAYYLLRKMHFVFRKLVTVPSQLNASIKNFGRTRVSVKFF